MIADVRSYKEGQVSAAEVVAAVGRSRNGYTRECATAALDEIEDYTGDIWFADGNLDIPGDLELTKERVFLLIVLGDLTVGGLYGDDDDPESIALVTGDMRARDVVTAGWLEVHGDLSTDRLIGDYNDCGAYIGGDIRAQIFYGEYHHFAIGGALGADAVIGRPSLDISSPPPMIDIDDPRMLDYFDRDLLRVYDEQDDEGNIVTYVDGFDDFHALKQRVFAGLPFRTTAARDA